MRKLVTVAVLLTVAAVASADLQWVIVEVTDADHVARGLRAFEVSLVGTTATIPAGAGPEVPGDEASAIEGMLTGDLSQCWFNGTGPTVDSGSPWTLIASPLAMKLDTHLLPVLATQAVVPPTQVPTEDSDLPGGNVETIDTFYQRGMGTKMTSNDGVSNFAFGFDTGNQELVKEVALVVVPADGNAHLSAIAVARDQTPVTIEHDFIPEPAALVLLGVGALGTMIRRKRRA